MKHKWMENIINIIFVKKVKYVKKSTTYKYLDLWGIECQTLHSARFALELKRIKGQIKRPRLLMAMMTTFSPFSILCLRKKNWSWKIFFPSFLKNLFDMWDGENCDGEMWDGDKFDGEMWASVNNVHCTIVHSQELQVWNCSYLYDTNITRLLLRIPV